MRGERGLIAAFAVAALALHVHFHVLDARPPVDLGHYYRDAITTYVRGAPPRFASPYASAVGGLFLAFGPRAAVLEALDGLWLVALVVGLGLCGRAVGGALGAAVAMAPALLFPSAPTMARTHWIHHPEWALAAFGLGLAATLGPSARAGAAVGVVLAAGSVIRPSAAAWMAVPLVVWAARAGSWRARAPALAQVALALIAMAPAYPGYLAGRVDLRAANTAAIGHPLAFLGVEIGWASLAVYGALAVAAAFAAGDRAVRIAAAAWLFGGLAVAFGANVTPDNVPVVFAGLAILAGAGAAALPTRVRAAVPVALAILAVGPMTQLAPPLGALAPVTGWTADDAPLNWLVPRPDGITAEALLGAAAAACPPGRGPRRLRERGAPCRILSDHGLVHPSWEDDGALAWFVAGRGGVQIVPATAPRPGDVWDAAVDIDCAGPIPDPEGRFPGTAERFARVRAAMTPVATLSGNGCTWRWYTRRGLTGR